MTDELKIPQVPSILGHSETPQPKLRRGQPTGERAVRYYVRKKKPKDELRPEERVPTEVKGIQTDVVELGDLKALSPFHEVPGINIGRIRPLRAGYSVGHYRVTAGTLGAIVWKQGWPWEAVLSNCHVLANSISVQAPSRAGLWDAVFQPGPSDGGMSADQIAWLFGWTPLVEGPDAANEVDRAWALLSYSVAYRIAPLRRPRLADLGLEVAKDGRTTGYTESRIFDTAATLLVDYGLFTARFIHQVIAMPGMGLPGDSGSLVRTREWNPVGLLFAGSSQATIVNPLDKVLADGLELVGIAS